MTTLLHSRVTRYALLTVLAVAALTLYAAFPAFAQAAGGVSAADLADPVKAGAQTAVIAGFGIAVVMLVAVVIYRAVRKFMG